MNDSSPLPILYSFCRCPYAMRARLGIASSGLQVELREILLRDKAPEFLAASAKGTVPVLVLPDGTVIDESLDILLYALDQHDPEGLLSPDGATREDMLALIAQSDGPFKSALDRYKYANRYGDVDPQEQRAIASQFLIQLDERLGQNNGVLFGKKCSLADIAILPFVRQFSNVDREWFDSQNWPALRSTLDDFLSSEKFAHIMPKYAKWVVGDAPIIFGA
ncbi:MAG: glutathione S-transferase [Hyphomicrobiales bacterium]|nr:glutathione S-transferase [Hyphomicrobiales bacterium]PCJ95182.1 MAG: glutathione S-transferase [Hyphomicrobiales bacterium]